MVKGEMFSGERVVGNALTAARVYGIRGVDELMIMDITATKEGREPDYKMVEELTGKIHIPVTIGGGISELKHIRRLLNAGADKVCIGTARSLIPYASDSFGRQCITASLDYRFWHYPEAVKGSAQILEAMGAGEILLQCMDRDGTMRGYDLEMIQLVAQQVGVPLIASGGCSDYHNMVQAIDSGADAVAAGALFQFTSATPKGAALAMNENNIEVRL